MIVLAPGSPVWDLARHVSWLAPAVIVLTASCVFVTPVLLLGTWFRPSGLRCVLALIAGLILVILARRVIADTWYIPRPFVADHFTPLFPHSRDSSFPSATAGYFAVVAIPAACAWRRLWWLFAAIALEVAFGCVYVGVHYITDVAAGAAIGLAAGGLAWAVSGLPPVLRTLARADAVLSRLRLRRSYGTQSLA